MNKHLVRLLFISICVLFLHYVATMLYLYWTVWWFDIPMHFLGGVAVGAALAYFCSLRKKNVPRWVYGVAALVIGIVWELFEIWNGDTTLRDWPDMSLDLIMDVLGGLAAYHLTRDDS